MKMRQRVCFHSRGNRSSRDRSECSPLCRTVAPHEDHEVIGHSPKVEHCVNALARLVLAEYWMAAPADRKLLQPLMRLIEWVCDSGGHLLASNVLGI